MNAIEYRHSDLEILVVDIAGREIMRKSLNADQGQYLWDTRTVPRGVYLVEL